MFEILAKIYNGRELVKYEVLDKNTGKHMILSIEQTYGLAMSGALINASYNEKNNNLSGKNNYDLRTLPRKQDRISKNKTSLKCLIGRELLDNVNIAKTEYKKERYLVNRLMYYLNNPCKGKICMLYGLRRTGKTVMMKHAVYNLINNGITNVAFITVTEQTSLAHLYNKINELVKSDYKYIFIDEITAISGFIQSSALLADAYATSDIHIIIAGTDSLVLELAGRDNLYDRYIKIDTSYISYKEYEYLNNGVSILDYMRLGGTLVSDTFYNNEKTKDYINTSITNNIINSLIRANNKKEHQRLLELEQRGLLSKAIEQTISSANNELTLNVIVSTYINEDLGSAKQLMEKVFDIDSTLDTEEVEERVRYKLRVLKDFDTEINPQYIEDLQDFLEEIGVLQIYTRYIGKNNGYIKVKVPLFVQSGLRYRQMINLVESLSETGSFFNIPKQIRKQFIDKIIQDIEGNLLEHIILLNCLNKYKDRKVEVTQLNYNGKEIDMIIHDDNIVDLYEIKRNSNIVDKQYRWLENEQFNNYIEDMYGCKIRNRIVLYLGGNNIINSNNGYKIYYKNISEFLKQL